MLDAFCSVVNKYLVKSVNILSKNYHFQISKTVDFALPVVGGSDWCNK